MPRVVPGFDLKVTLLLDLLQKEMHKGGMTFEPLKRRVTFQDPCRLGRMLNRTGEPAGTAGPDPGDEACGNGTLRAERRVLRQQRLHQLRRLLQADPGAAAAGGQSDRSGSADHGLSQVHDPPDLCHARPPEAGPRSRWRSGISCRFWPIRSNTTAASKSSFEFRVSVSSQNRNQNYDWITGPR